MNHTLEIKKLSKEFIDETGFKNKLFQNISFKIAKGSITTLLAPTGSGKTSFLKIVSGLDKPTTGETVNENSNIVFIPSAPSSFPWMTVEENIQFVLKEKSDVKKIIKLVGLEGYENHIPNNKSLGFRFRISLARALALNPSLIVLDEPFIQMDVQTKSEIYELVRNINNSEKQTILLGTTNITEAIYLSDKIILMKKSPGEILQEINVEFGKERTLEILDKEEFHSLRTRIEKIYKESHNDGSQSQKLFNLSI